MMTGSVTETSERDERRPGEIAGQGCRVAPERTTFRQRGWASHSPSHPSRIVATGSPKRRVRYESVPGETSLGSTSFSTTRSGLTARPAMKASSTLSIPVPRHNPSGVSSMVSRRRP